ncbi:MAG: alpha/beta hydrolase [Gammaproteobacteria bacterium]|nr:alpha/beta hydrolase [Gammaproteobacteria bacterium]
MPLAIVREIFDEFTHTVAVPLRDAEQLQVRVFGSSMGQSVLMLPGLGMSASHWLPMIAPYAFRYRFYLPDLRGLGLSANLAFNQADVFQNHMEDVQDVISHFKLKDMLLVGYSLGATTAMHLQRAGQFERVKRYLHIDQTPCIRNQADWSYGLLGAQQESLFKLMREANILLEQYPSATYLGDIPALMRGSIVDKLQQIHTLLSGEPFLKTWFKPIILAFLPLSNKLPLTRVDHLRAYFAAYSGEGHDYRASLKTCTTPITQIVGMSSRLYHPKGQMHIADCAQNVNVVKFDDSGHAPFFHEPRKFVRVLGDFLAG